MKNYEKLQKAIFGAKQKGVCDGMIVTTEENQLYVTGFEYTDGYAIVTKNGAYLITDSRYIEAAKAECAEGVTPLLYRGLSDGVIKNIIEKDGVKTLLFESRVPFGQLEALKKAFPGINFKVDSEINEKGVIETLRDLKETYEKNNIIKAQRIAEKSLDMLLGDINTDMTEVEVAALLEFYMKKNGSIKPSFDTIAITGTASSRPHGVPRNVKLEKGFLTIDFGAMYKGYHSDMTRTFAVGKPNAEMKKIYDTVLKAQEKAIDAILKGERNCVRIDGISRKIITRAGYGEYFGHGLGHGVGLEIHESPRLSPKAGKDASLIKGHVVTVEPGIYLEGKYGVRIEDMMYIGREKAENLTKFPKNLIEI